MQRFGGVRASDPGLGAEGCEVGAGRTEDLEVGGFPGPSPG